MNYGNLVKRPFEIVARRPYLWLLGFLAGGATSANFSSASSSSSRSASTTAGPSWTTLQNVWNDNATWILTVLAILAVVAIVMFVLSCIATGGIIHAAVEHDQGRPYTLRQAWRAGYATGWRIAGLKVLTFLLAIVPGLLIGSLTVATVAGAASSPLLAVTLGLLAAAAFVASLAFWLLLGPAYELAQRQVVLDGANAADALTNGFRMIRWHFRQVALGWLILVALGVAAGVAFAVLAVVTGVPAAALAFAGWAAAGWTGVIILGTFAAVFLLGVLAAAGGAYAAYSSVYWTLLYGHVRSLPLPAARGAVHPA